MVVVDNEDALHPTRLSDERRVTSQSPDAFSHAKALVVLERTGSSPTWKHSAFGTQY